MLAALLCGAAAVLAAAFAAGGYTAQAAVIKSLEMTDDFNGETLNADAWSTTGGVDQKTDYSALRIEGNDLWGSYVVFQQMPLDETWESFTIEMKMNWVGFSGWTGIFFGAANSRDFYYTSPSAYFLHIRNAGIPSAGEEEGLGIRLCPRDPSSGVGFYSEPDKTDFALCDIYKAGDLLAGGAVQDVVMEFTKIADDPDNAFSMSFKWRDLGSEEDYKSISFDRIEIGGYMGFKTMDATTLELRSFALSTGTGSGKELLYQTNFEDGDISFPSLPDSTTEWCATPNAGIEEYVYCGKFCTVSFAGVQNGSLVYTDPVEGSSDSLKVFDISYDISLTGLTENTYIGSGFALAEYTSDPSEEGFIGFRKTADGFAVAHVKDGAVAAEEDIGSISGLTATVKFTGYFDGTVRVFVGNREVAAFEGVPFSGYTTVSAVTLTEAAAPQEGCSIDNYTLYVYEAIAPNGEDAGINFKGVREYELAGIMVDEHYVNTRDWIMYGGVKTPMQTSRNYIMFHDITGDAAFLSKDIYGDQIVRFDFRPSSLPDESLAAFGYSFGRELLDTAYDEAPGVYFRKEGDSTVVYGMNMTASGGATQAVCPLNVFAGTDTWYTCMLIVSARTVKVYLKETAAPDSAFGDPIITFSDVDSYGYTAWMIESATGKNAYYYATNLSIVNIDPMLVGGGEE